MKAQVHPMFVVVAWKETRHHWVSLIYGFPILITHLVMTALIHVMFVLV
jgi:hypothetical protein